jgi:hypothetical protein
MHPVTPPILLPLLALDPSSTRIGWALFGPDGNYVTSNVCLVPDAPSSDERVPLAGMMATALVNQLRPAAVALEIPDYVADFAVSQNLLTYSRAVGAVEHAVSLHRVPVYRVHASRMKAETGKQQRKNRFHQAIGRLPLTDDESDAYVMGIELLTAARAACQPRPPVPDPNPPPL